MATAYISCLIKSNGFAVRRQSPQVSKLRWQLVDVKTMEDTVWKERRCLSNLPLQILISSNVYLSVLWSLFFSYCIFGNVLDFSTIQTIIKVFGFILSVFVEIPRLYLGYSGNLHGKSSDLGGFLILTVLIQTPINLYILFHIDYCRIPSILLQCFMLFWFIAESALAMYTSRKLLKYESSLFEQRQMKSE